MNKWGHKRQIRQTVETRREHNTGIGEEARKGVGEEEGSQEAKGREGKGEII